MTESLSNTSYFRYLDKLPFGMDEGATKLALCYQVSSLAMSTPTEEVLDVSSQRISNFAQKIEQYKQRSEQLSGSFSKVAKRFAGMGLSFVGENAVIFGAAAVGAAVGGPMGGIAGTTTATFPQVYGAAFLKEMDDAGYDVKAPEQIRDAFHDADFMKHARRASFIHAGQTSGAVLSAGALAGYVYSAAAKPVASAGASVARSVLPRIVGEVTEKSLGLVGDLCAKGVKSAVNIAGKKAVQRVPLRAMFLTAAMSGAVAEAEVQPEPVHVKPAAYNVSQSGFPSYNTSLRYI